MVSGILVFSLRGTWVSILSQSVVGAKRKSLPKIWARVYIDTAVDDAAAVLQRRCFLWILLELFLPSLSKCQTRPLRLVKS